MSQEYQQYLNDTEEYERENGYTFSDWQADNEDISYDE
jgi:hypothetical protein